MRRATVVIADRHPMVLQGLASVLGSESDFEVVASCGDAASCIQAILTLAPDIAIMDAAMPGLTALMNNSLSHSDSRPTRFVFFAPSEDYDLVLAGAPAGYSVLLKEMTGQAVVQGLRDIANGQTVVPLSPTDQAAPREHSPKSGKCARGAHRARAADHAPGLSWPVQQGNRPPAQHCGRHHQGSPPQHFPEA